MRARKAIINRALTRLARDPGDHELRQPDEQAGDVSTDPRFYTANYIARGYREHARNRFRGQREGRASNESRRARSRENNTSRDTHEHRPQLVRALEKPMSTGDTVYSTNPVSNHPPRIAHGRKRKTEARDQLSATITAHVCRKYPDCER